MKLLPNYIVFIKRSVIIYFIGSSYMLVYKFLSNVLTTVNVYLYLQLNE
jgi:hypothetical protein